MTEQIQSVASIDDFEANRAKTKKALPALLIVFTLGTLMIQAFNLVFQNIGDSLGMSSSASLISTLPGIVLGVVCMLYGTLCDFISPKRMTLFGVVALVAGSFFGVLWLVQLLGRAHRTYDSGCWCTSCWFCVPGDDSQISE